MAERFGKLEQEHIDFIGRQAIYFVATAGEQGRVNLSPKGMDSLRVLDANRVAWLNLTGSGNETAAHVLENGRMTIMFCSFDRQPLILRLYGQAKVIHPRDAAWQEMIPNFPSFTGARQVFDLAVDLVQTSCGFAVPEYEFLRERPTLDKWADNKGREAVEQYWLQKNTLSLDGRPTGIIDQESTG